MILNQTSWAIVVHDSETASAQIIPGNSVGQVSPLAGNHVTYSSLIAVQVHP